MSRIFISYRRQDSATMTGRIYDRLESALGGNRVFRDIDDISPGEDFRAKLAKEINKSDVLLVIIGPKWETITNAEGKRRLDDPNDFVRLEVEAGLRRADTIVIPVLAEGAAMPSPDKLPETMRELCYRNAVNVRQDPDFHRDIQKLIKNLQEIDKRAAPPLYKRTPVFIAIAVVVLALLGSWSAGLFQGAATPTPVEPSSTLQDTATVPASSPTVAITDTVIATLEAATSTSIATSVPVLPAKVAVIQIPEYIFTDIVPRLDALGYNAEWISVYSDYSTFSQYDVVYLPVGWAYQKAVIDQYATQYQRFVEEGGGLIVEQPNYGNTLKPSVVPYDLMISPMLYDPAEWPARVALDHAIVKNVPASELPGPGNRVSVKDDHWVIVTTSAKSNDPTLIVAEYGKGRIALVATSVSENDQIRYQLGDSFIKNLFAWVQSQ
jgi:hypothetical protein